MSARVEPRSFNNVLLQWAHGCASEHLYFFSRHLSQASIARGVRRLFGAGVGVSFASPASISLDVVVRGSTSWDALEHGSCHGNMG